MFVDFFHKGPMTRHGEGSDAHEYDASAEEPAVPSNDEQQHNNQSSGTGVIGEITGATTDPPAELVHHEQPSD
jgi:hypothetical protein